MMDIVSYREEDKFGNVKYRHWFGEVIDFLVYHSKNGISSAVILNVYHVKEGEEEERVMEFLKNKIIS